MKFIRLVGISDLDIAEAIINDGKAFIKGKTMQWQQGYPNRFVLNDDINKKQLYGCYDDNQLIGVAAFISGIEKTYLSLLKGKWNKEPSQKDLVIHRIAVKKEYYNKGVGTFIIQSAIKLAKDKHLVSLKADTHPKNEPMVGLLIKNGFAPRGEIFLNSEPLDGQRVVFEYDIEG